MIAAPSDSRPLVILPSYNSGKMLLQTTRAVLAEWQPVWVVLDGSTDSSGAEVTALADEEENLKVLKLPENVGKGGAVLAAMQAALAAGFTHALVMDADGQHPPESIVPFMRLSKRNPEAMILGEPVFGADAPPERVQGRRVGNALANFETLGGGIHDSLFGFRLYPIKAAVEVLESIRSARRFDFDTELAVRLFWKGLRPVNQPVPVRYPTPSTGGITHFRYLRDNLLLAGTHLRLCLLLLPRLRRVWTLRQKWLLQPEISSPPAASPPQPLP